MYFPMPFIKNRLSEKFHHPQKNLAREMPTNNRRNAPAGFRVFVLVRVYQSLHPAGALRTIND
jgi:hypothetical protein